MAASRQSQQDKYDELVLKTIEGVDKKVDRQEERLDKIDGKISKLWSTVFSTPQAQSIKDLPPVWRDPAVIKLLTYFVVFAIIVAIIIAALTGTQLPAGLL